MGECVRCMLRLSDRTVWHTSSRCSTWPAERSCSPRRSRIEKSPEVLRYPVASSQSDHLLQLEIKYIRYRLSIQPSLSRMRFSFQIRPKPIAMNQVPTTALWFLFSAHAHQTMQKKCISYQQISVFFCHRTMSRFNQRKKTNTIFRICQQSFIYF